MATPLSKRCSRRASISRRPTTPLRQHYVGLEEVGDGIWSLYFNRVLLARFDEREYVLPD